MSIAWRVLVSFLVVGALVVAVAPERRGQAATTSRLFIPISLNRVDQSTSGLQISITNLPSGAAGDILVTGPLPATTSRRVTQSQTLAVPTGQYRVVSQPVAVGSLTYYATVQTAVVNAEGGSTVPIAIDYRTIVPDTTKVLSDAAVATIISAAPDASTITFSAAAPLPALAPGAVIVGGAAAQTPAGLLRKVTGVSTNLGQIIVTTEPATLLDAVPQGSLAIQTTLTPTAAVRSGAGTTLVPTQRGATSLTQDIHRTVRCSSGESIEIVGSVTLMPSDVDFSVEWSFGGVGRARFVGTITASASLTATAQASAGCAVGPMALLPDPIKFPQIWVQVGPVPVPIEPQLQVYLNADGSLGASTSAGVSYQASVTAGVEYVNGGGFTPLASHTESFSANPPTASLAGRLNASLTPTLSLLMYGQAGPTIDVVGGVRFVVAPTETPWCTLKGVLGAGAGLTVPRLNLSYSNPSIFQTTRDLYTCSAAPATPIPTKVPTTAPTAVPTAIPTPIGTATATPAPGAWSVAYQFDSAVGATDRSVIPVGLEQGRAYLQSTIGDPTTGRVTVYVHKGPSDYCCTGGSQRIDIWVDHPQWTRADALAMWGRPDYFGVYADLSSEHRKHLAHEYTHVWQSFIGCSSPRVFRWWEEGQAEWTGRQTLRRYGGQNESALQTAKWNDFVQDTTPLSGYETSFTGYTPYGISFWAFERLVQRFGEAGLLTVCQQTARGTPMAQAFQSTFGISLQQFYADFADYRNQVRSGPSPLQSASIARAAVGIGVPR